MKIGIFTLTDALNYGAFYQMFALQAYIKENYRNVDVVIYKPKDTIIKKIKRNVSINPKRLFRKQILYKRFRSCQIDINIKTYKNDILDIAFIGSDEIWNVENRSFDNNPNFFGLKIQAVKKIDYAPSIGYSKLISLEAHPDFIGGIKALDYILYRDSHTKDFLNKIGITDTQRVADPTILYDNWENHLEDINISFSKKYVVYYSYLSTPPFLDDLLKYAKKNNFLIISSGYKTHSWADLNLTLNPWQFLSLLKNSECVFTTTFHGSIMSTLLNKQLIISKSSKKVSDLISVLEIEHYDSNKRKQKINEILEKLNLIKIKNKKDTLKLSSREIINKLMKS